MKTTTKNTGIKVTTNVKGGGLGFNGPNHSRSALKVKAGIKAGTVIQLTNHSRRPLTLTKARTNAGIKVATSVKSGGLGFNGCNHSGSALKVKVGIKAGTTIHATNHNVALRVLA